MREVITPWLAREQEKAANVKWHQAADDSYWEGRKRRTAEALEAVWGDIPEPMRRRIRMQVALSVPDKPMSADELQIWLDERCIGVVRYMTTGKIV